MCIRDRLKTVPISLHCWQGDDVRGFDTDPTKPLTGGIACAQLHQGVGIHRQLILKCFQHRLRAIALSGSFPCGSLRLSLIHI